MTTKVIFFVMASFFLCSTAESQILKKLRKKAEAAAERTILKRTDKEVSEQTDKSLDSILEGGKTDAHGGSTEDKGSMSSLFGGGMEGIPETYTFQYIMDMKMTSNKDDLFIKYYIAPKASYFGTAVDLEGNNSSLVVYDMDQESMVTFMDTNGQKMAIKINIPLDEDMQNRIKNGNSNETGTMDDVKITTLPNKTILGYHCKGYQIEQENGISKIYVTNEAPVSFSGMFANMKNLQKHLDMAVIPFEENSMMLEMEFLSHKRKKDNVHLICTAIKEQAYSISKADYKGM